MKQLLLGIGFLALAPTARACTADVEVVKTETDGTDVVNTFRVSKETAGKSIVTFDATTRYMHKGQLTESKSAVSAEISGETGSVEWAEHPEQQFDEIVDVRVDNVRCTP